MLYTPAEKFQEVVDWLTQLINKQGAPGFLIGLSGTDSIAAFMACSKAFEKLGAPEKVTGVHYARVWSEPQNERARLVLQNSPSVAWFQRQVIPWLRTQAPHASIVVDDSIDYTSDAWRWAALAQRSLGNNKANDMFDQSKGSWVVGTRNSTEEALGSWSNISKLASLQPIIRLWKSDVINICQRLGVPEIAIIKSRQVDCDCGRFDLAAEHIEEVDAILKAQKGLIEEEWLESNIDKNILERLKAFVREQQDYNLFKSKIPYTPPA